MQPKSKWKFAIGTTSRVPDSRGLHYLIADFDDPLINRIEVFEFLAQRPCRKIIQDTPHGWHLYTDLQMPFHELIKTLHKIGADPAWIEIGKTRRYLFLADKKEVKFRWPVEHMMLRYVKEKTQNA